MNTSFWERHETHLIGKKLITRGLGHSAIEPPRRQCWQWAIRHGWVDDVLVGRVRELAEMDAEHFTYAVLRDAMVENDPHLCDDALVERWAAELGRQAELAERDAARVAAYKEVSPTLLATVRTEAARLRARQDIANTYVADFVGRLRTHIRQLLDEATEQCHAELRVHSAGTQRAEAGRPRLVVATDASGQGGQACGYGWISEEGHLGYGLTITTDPGQAEMIAICKAATAPELLDWELLILSDSKGSVDLLNRVFEHGVNEVRRRTRHPLDWMRQAYAHRQRIQVAWIKGHAGHLLNAAADRLASLAVEEGRGVPSSQITAIVEDIKERITRSLVYRSAA